VKLPPLALLALALTTVARAQSSFIYAFSDKGLVSANAYALDVLPQTGGSKNSSGSTDKPTWQDLFVRGPDRWLIRDDGEVSRNGAHEFSLSDSLVWRRIVVDDADDFFALSKGGRVSGAAGIVVDYDAGIFSFTDLATDGQTVYALKSNGAVFRVPEPDAVVKFNGPPGEISGKGADGEAADVTWVRLLIDPIDGKLWGLRHDGILQSADVPARPPTDPAPGVPEASLPYNNSDGSISIDQLYADFSFDTDGSWFALRNDGRLFSVKSQDTALVDLPGGPSVSGNQAYVALVVSAGHTIALRADGKLFGDLEPTAITDLKGNGYVGLALGSQLPDLAKVKNQKPVGTSMTITAPEGADISLPVVATDRDKASADLLVDIVAETLPAGATWDGPSRTISWPSAGPAGKYKIKVTVDDGLAKPVTCVQTITIKPIDADAAKNIKPSVAKVSNAVALVELPFELQVLAFDLDGDALTLSQDVGASPPPGTSFDALTGSFTWAAPAVGAAGTHSFKFLADDGTAQSKRTIKVKVQTSLLAF
jgi:hypothetical protein